MKFVDRFDTDIAYLDVPARDGRILDSWGKFTADFPVPVVRDSSGTIVGDVWEFSRHFQGGVALMEAHGLATFSIAHVLNNQTFRLAFDLLDFHAEIRDGGTVFLGGRIVCARLIKAADWNWA